MFIISRGSVFCWIIGWADHKKFRFNVTINNPATAILNKLLANDKNCSKYHLVIPADQSNLLLWETIYVTFLQGLDLIFAKKFHSTIFILICLCTCLFTAGFSVAGALPFSIAFYYADNHPIDELKAFDIAVVDPDSGLPRSSYVSSKSELFAYVSLGEADPARSYSGQMDAAWFIGTNKSWNTRVIDTSNPEWRQFFIEKVIAPLWEAGYRGFFVDTIDSYRLAAGQQDFPRMENGIVATIKELRKRFPGVRLILNRGFEVVGRLKGDVYAVAAESLFQGYDRAKKSYAEVPGEDREWLLARLKEVQATGVPVIAIDYVSPEKRELARQTADKIKGLGIIPWVSDPDLSGLGVGSIEVMPRKILGFYDGGEGGGDPFFGDLQRYAVMPLNHLGYTVELRDLREPLPEGVLSGRYAGVLVWPYSDRSGEASGLKDWTLRRIKEGLPVVFLDRFGFGMDGVTQRALGLELDEARRARAPVKIVQKDSRIGFEQQPLPQADSFLPLTLKEGTSLLRLNDARGMASDAAAITPWGGYVLSPYVVTRLFGDQTAWVVDPFRFFKDALRLPDMPVPDTTTENGVRLLLSHVDGDGFESLSEWPGGGLAADELRLKILEKYRLPVTVSVITGTLAPNGLYPARSARLVQAARTVFSLPFVEAASHSFSHPFRWKPEQEASSTELPIWHNLTIPNYSFDLAEEIGGSLRYINQNLLPKGKQARLFLWTGNCVPGEEALKLTYQAGAYNINGGDTLMTESYLTLTAVAPLGISRNGWFQVFAPNQNENVYTGLWTENFYGYRRVLETFRLTDFPRRLKPVNIYYHFYSATKEASLNALDQVYGWAVAQKLFAVFTTEYIAKVLDFNRSVVARDGSGWLIRTAGDLRQFRIPRSAGFPDLAGSINVSGFSDHGDNRYIHLLPGNEARITLSAAMPAIPFLAQAGGRLDSMERSGQGLKLGFSSYTPFEVRIANLAGCRVRDQKGTTYPTEAGFGIVGLPEGKHALDVDCP